MEKTGELRIEAQRLNTVWKRENKPVLQLTGSLPRLPGHKRLNAYYRRLEQQLQQYCLKKLLPQLPPENPKLSLLLSFEPRFASQNLLSITCDLQRLFREAEPGESALAAGVPAARFAAVWDLGNDTPLPLKHFLASGKGCLLRQLAEKAQSRLEGGQALYYPDCALRVRRCFSRDHYFIREDGIVFFYPPLTLGPKAEGIPQFFFPWSENWLRAPGDSMQKPCIPAPLRAIIPTSKKRRDL